MTVGRAISTEIEHLVKAESIPDARIEDHATSRWQDVTERRHWELLLGSVPPDIAGTGKLIKGSGEYLTNGARFYVDVGTYAEWANPEEVTIDGVIASEIRSEPLVANACMTLVREKKFGRISVARRAIAQNGATNGYHENYQVEARHLDPTQFARDIGKYMMLALHLATRTIFAGAGCILLNAGEPVFSTGQKVTRFATDYSTGAVYKKPLVSLRDERLASEKWQRIHVTSGDPTFLPRATAMKLGTTSIVLAMLEKGIRLDKRVRPEPGEKLHQYARNVALDPKCKALLKLEDGRTITAVDLQSEFVAAAQELKNRKVLSAEELRVLAEWERVCNVIRRDPMELKHHYDWPAKLYLLEKEMAKGKGLDHTDVRLIDLQWGRIDIQGYGQKVRAKVNDKDWLPPLELVESRRTTPPPTRAAARVQLLKYIAAHKLEAEVNWHHIKFTDREGEHEFNMGDPRQAVYSEVEEFLASRR